MYKVFIQDKPVFFAPSENLLLKKNIATLEPYSQESVSDYIAKITVSNFEPKCFFGGFEEKLETHPFFESHNYIKAAGGIVLSNNCNALVMQRLGKWDLPKGKIEENETVEEAAVREVEEECGLSGIQIINLLTTTFHCYEAFGKKWLKETTWFVMENLGESTLTPQKEEGITEVKWIGVGQLQATLKDSYNSIKDVVAEFNAQQIQE